MKMMKKILVGLVLASCAMVNASAAPIKFTGWDWPMSTMDPDSLLQIFDFSAIQPDAKAGDTFEYDFTFNSPPMLSVFNVFGKATDNSVAFTDAGLFNFGDSAAVAGFMFNTTGSTFGASVDLLDSGLYDFIIAGTFLKDGGGFQATATTDVPEPVSIALLAAGMAGMAGVRRRRSVAKSACAGAA